MGKFKETEDVKGFNLSISLLGGTTGCVALIKSRGVLRQCDEVFQLIENAVISAVCSILES